MNGTKEKY